MAHMMDEWEQRIYDEKKKAEAKSKKLRLAAFKRKWRSATPEQQAEIIFNLKEELEDVGETAHEASFHHMRF